MATLKSSHFSGSLVLLPSEPDGYSSRNINAYQSVPVYIHIYTHRLESCSSEMHVIRLER